MSVGTNDLLKWKRRVHDEGARSKKERRKEVTTTKWADWVGRSDIVAIRNR